MPPDLTTPGGASPDAAPETQAWVEAWIARAWRTWRLTGAAHALACGAGLGLVAWPWLDGSWRWSATLGIALGVIAARLGGRRFRDVRCALAAVEARHPALGNAVIAWHETHASLPPVIAGRLARQARAGLGGLPASTPYGGRAWTVAAACLLAGGVSVLVAKSAPQRTSTAVGEVDTAPSAARVPSVEWRAVVVPPAYTRRPPTTTLRPVRLEVLAGSRVELGLRGWPADGRAILGAATLAVSPHAGGHLSVFTATASDVLLLRDGSGTVVASIALVVRPDAAPATRIVAPAADVRRDAASGRIAVRITAQDDIGLRDLRLRFTKVSGSGESFTFVDGDWPLAIARESATAWTATYVIDLASLGLAPGDSVVYHALAHDARPGPEGAAESERYLIEITKPGARSSGEYSLPEPEEKFALSQRMVIQLTERLLERRPRLSAAEYLGEAQALAVAQRRVRAEFVFMLGGEVEDEVAEAEHSHEVEAGRLDNRGQGELTEAVRQMAQAESRLTAAALREALPYEYKALAAVQAAFGKSRYFMRTLPTPVQIDPARRLQGDRADARSATWTHAPLPETAQAAGLAVLRRLETLAAGDARGRVAVIPGLVALDRGNPEWVAAAQRLGGGADGVGEVARALRARLVARAVRWTPVPLPGAPAESALTSERRRPGEARRP
jgi:hypothetical protein